MNKQARNRSSEVEEPTEESIRQELAELERMYRIMMKEDHSYRAWTTRILNKQECMIHSLEKEKLELDTCLAKLETQQNINKNAQATSQLLDLTRTEKEYQELIKAERNNIKELDRKILEAEKCISKHRKNMSSNSTTKVTKHIATEKRKAVLENRLDKTMVHFNRQMAVNQKLRADIDHLRQERAVFDNLYKKLASKLQRGKREIVEVIEMSTHAFEQRDEAQNKMMALMERNDKDRHQHDSEMKELQRIISHDNKIKEFMMIKGSDRAELKAEEAEKRQNMKGNAQHSANADLAAIASYEESFNKISEVTNKNDINVIVNDFIRVEDENFALFNYVNELNSEVENVQEQVAGVRGEIEKFQEQDQQVDKNHKQLLVDLETKYNKSQQDAQSAEQHLRDINKILDQLQDGVNRVFKRIGCDPRPIHEMLGEKSINNKNVMVYLGLIEQKTIELLNHRHFDHMKKAALEGIQATLAPMAPKDKSATPAPISVPPPSLNVDDEMDDQELEDLMQPLSDSELRQLVLRRIDCRSAQTPQPEPQKSTKTNRKKKSSRTH